MATVDYQDGAQWTALHLTVLHSSMDVIKDSTNLREKTLVTCQQYAKFNNVLSLCYMYSMLALCILNLLVVLIIKGFSRTTQCVNENLQVH